MNIYFDTEFTGLHKNTTLISLGCVAEDGKTFYAEFDDYEKEQCNDWIQENVIKNLKIAEKHIDRWTHYTPILLSDSSVSDLRDGYCPNMKGSKTEVRDEFVQWLLQFDSVQFVSDVSHYDFVLLIDLFGTAFDLPENVSASCHDINQDIARHYGIPEREAFDKSREEIVAESPNVQIYGDKHNALYDARVIKAIYEKLVI
ncbi:3'-5' exoribonuclease domain-containing protein [Lacrimispora sp.]|uniref:3'-5' exoribonuclease domain-containing protein n=1 Tax=Lacrimispora sp. TaxID=2719234 RepID=UPI0028A187FF|nr:3'-5' exoribonuclease [Lacrimispora sp.]